MKIKKSFHQDLIIPSLGLIIGGYFLIASQKIIAPSDNFPKVFSMLVLVLSVINLIDAVGQHKKGKKLLAEGAEAPGMICLPEFKIPAIATVGLIAYIVAIQYIGYFLSTAVFMPAMTLSLKYKNWKGIVATTVIMEVFIYLLFVKFLGVRMPHALFF
ncbi:MAG: tripartite tricarboxylate transporter TctB family protein [Christensenellales bacterium]